MDYQEAIETIQYASAFNSENSRLTKALDVAISAMQELQELQSSTNGSDDAISLDEAILHAKKVAERNRNVLSFEPQDSVDEEIDRNCLKCAKEHEQLAVWLEELKQYKQLGNLEEVREAVEKRKAKKPENVGTEGYRYTDTYRCPTCGGNFSGTGLADYCYHCGQKLNWSEEEK